MAREAVAPGEGAFRTWTTPSFVAGIAYGLYQTSSDTGKSTMSGGFASSVYAANG